MSDKELLGTKSGVSLALIDADRKVPMPGVPSGSVAYEIRTDLRSEMGDTVILTTGEATRVAFAILRDRFLKLGKQKMALEGVCKMFGLDLSDLTLDGNPEYRGEKGT